MAREDTLEWQYSPLIECNACQRLGGGGEACYGLLEPLRKPLRASQRRYGSGHMRRAGCPLESPAISAGMGALWAPDPLCFEGDTEGSRSVICGPSHQHVCIS